MDNITHTSIENALEYIHGYSIALELLFDKNELADSKYVEKLDRLKKNIIKIIDLVINKIKDFFSKMRESEQYDYQLHMGMKKYFDDGISETKRVLNFINTTYSITMDYDLIKNEFDSLLSKWNNLKVMMSKAKSDHMEDSAWKRCQKNYFNNIQNMLINPLEKIQNEITKIDSDLDLDKKPYQTLVSQINQVIAVIKDSLIAMQYGQKNNMKFVLNNTAFSAIL